MSFEIRTLKDGELITEDGFYAISLDRHHDQPCDGVSVTSGVLRKMELETPDIVWATHKLNPDPWEKDDTKALRLGRAMAAMIEGGLDELENHFQVLPTTKPNKPTSAQREKYDEGTGTPAGIKSVEYWDAVDADPRDVLDGADLKLIKNMAKGLALDLAAQAALGGIPEITMAAFDEETQLWWLARPDQVSFSGMLSDYKKVAPSGRPFSSKMCDYRITDYGYDMQMAFACDVFERLTGNWPSQIGLVFQSDKVPHPCIFREITEEDLRIAQWRNRRAANLFRECLDNDNWYGAGEVTGTYQRPDWQRDLLLKEMKTAGTAP